MGLKGYEHKGPGYEYRKRKFPKEEWKSMQAGFADLLLNEKTKNVDGYKMLIIRFIKDNSDQFSHPFDKFLIWATEKCRQYFTGTNKPRGFDAAMNRVFDLVTRKRDIRIQDRRHGDAWTKVVNRKRIPSIRLTSRRVELIQRTVYAQARRAGVTQPFMVIFGDTTGEHWSSSAGAIQGISMTPAVLERHWTGGFRYHNGEFVLGSQIGYTRKSAVIYTLRVDGAGVLYPKAYEVPWTQISLSRAKLGTSTPSPTGP